MKSRYILIICMLGFLSCSKSENKAKLNVELDNFSKGKLYLEKETINGFELMDSVVLTSINKHTFYPEAKENSMYYLHLEKRGRAAVFVENKDMEVRVDANNMRVLSTKGSYSDSIFHRYSEAMWSRSQKINDMSIDLFVAKSEHNYKRIDSLEKRMKAFNRLKNNLALQFAFKNNKSVVSPYIALGFIHQIKQSILDSLYAKYPNKVKKSTYGKEFKDYLDNSREIKIHKKLSDFKILNKDFPIKGKYNLYYFWDKENIESLNNIHFMNSWDPGIKSKVEIIPINIKNTKIEVENLFKKEQINLESYNLEAGFEQEVPFKFAVRFIPFGLLTNPEGEIIAYGLDSSQLINFIK